MAQLNPRNYANEMTSAAGADQASDCTRRFARTRTIDVQALRHPALPRSLATHRETTRNQLAERAGFEPAVQLLTGHVFSKDAHSTTLPPLRTGENSRGRRESSQVYS